MNIERPNLECRRTIQLRSRFIVKSLLCRLLLVGACDVCLLVLRVTEMLGITPAAVVVASLALLVVTQAAMRGPAARLLPDSRPLRLLRSRRR